MADNLDTCKFTLAGTEYTVTRLNLRQLRALGVGAAASGDRASQPLSKAERENAGYESMLDVVIAGLSKDYPDITKDKLLDMTATFSELEAAHKKLYAFSGLLPAEPAAPGEAAAEGQQ